MEYFPSLSENELKEFARIYKKNYKDFYDNRWADEYDYAFEFDMLLDSNNKFKNFVNSFNEYYGDIITSDREAASFLKTCIDLGYYE